MDMSRDFVWMTPLAEVSMILLPALFFFLASRLWPRIEYIIPTIFICSLLAILNVLIFVPRLHHFAALLLAAGIATQVAWCLQRHINTFLYFVQRTVLWLLAIVATFAISAPAWRIIVEQQAFAKLPLAPANAPNVLLITLDTVRATNMSLYGYSRSTTPQLEKIGRTGIIFDRALSTAPWTLPSHASMFTGRWPHELSTDLETPLDTTYPTLAEFFRSCGYATAAFVANMKYCGYETGLDRGFLHYEDYRISLGQIASSSNLVRPIANNFRLRRFIQNDEHINRKRAAQINEEMLRWLSRERKRPFFIFLNYFDAHEPYLPPPPFDKKFGAGRKLGKYSPLHRWLFEPAVRHQNMNEENIQEEIDAYDGALAYLDYHLSLLFDELNKGQLMKNMLIIITSDHGEEFGEHSLFDHGYSLYLPSVHVPLLISFPDHLPAGKRIQKPVSLRDLASTIVDILDFEPNSPFPGKSLARYWEAMPNHESLLEEPLLSEVNHMPGQPAWFPTSKGDMKSLLFRGMRYIKNGDGLEELYDFNKDPWEEHNLADSDKTNQELKGFRELLGTALNRASSPHKPPNETAQVRPDG
jgi:arylsulfatase A-like enzyme